MRPLPKTGIIVLCGAALLLPLACVMKEGGLMSFSRDEPRRSLVLSQGFLISAIFFCGATVLSAFSSDCTLAVFFWVAGLLLLVCIGNRVTWGCFCDLIYSFSFRRAFTDGVVRRRLLVYGAALLVSAFLNFYSLTSIPYNIHGDEGEIAERALLLPMFKEFFRPQPLWWHLPTPDLLLQRIGFLVGDGLWAIRAGSAFYGVIANLLMLCFLRRMLSSWIAAGCWVLIITSPNLLQSYRQGLDVAVPVILSSLFVGLVVRLLGASANRGHIMILIGAVLGVSMIVYVSARGLLIGWGTISALLIVSAPTGIIAWRLLREVAVSWLVALLVMGPLVFYHITHPLVPRVREQYGIELREDFLDSVKTPDWFVMLDNRVAGSISTLFTQRERIGGDFYFYFAGLLPISVVVLSFISIASLSPRYRAYAIVLLVAVMTLVIAIGAPLRQYDRFHRVALVFPFFAVMTAIWLDTIRERLQGTSLRCGPGVLFSLCSVIAVYQVVAYVQTHGDAYEWEFVSPKTRAARALQAVLREFPESKVYCVTEPWFNCFNGTFRVLIPGISARAVNLNRESFNATKIPLDSGEITILSAGFDPLKEPGFVERLPAGTKNREWHLRAFTMGETLTSENALKAAFAGWRVPSVMPHRAPDVTVTTLIIP